MNNILKDKIIAIKEQDYIIVFDTLNWDGIENSFNEVRIEIEINGSIISLPYKCSCLFDKNTNTHFFNRLVNLFNNNHHPIVDLTNCGGFEDLHEFMMIHTKIARQMSVNE